MMACRGSPRVYRRRGRSRRPGALRARTAGGGPARRLRQRARVAAHPQPGAARGGLVRLRPPAAGAGGGRHGGHRGEPARRQDAAGRGDAGEHAGRGRGRLRAGPRADGQGEELMAVDVRFLGHAGFHISGAGADVLVDPFLTGNPKAAATADEVPADVILVTHGHGDHLGDTVAIAKRTGAHVVAIVELADELRESGLENVSDPNYGGTVKFDWGWVKLVPAWHTAISPSGTAHAPAGLLISYGGRLIYHLGDTCLFGDMKLIAQRGDKVDLALVPIGGHYTMDRYDAVTAVELINPQQVIPIHYNTFPPVETDAEAFKQDVQNAGFSEVVIVEPGETHRVR